MPKLYVRNKIQAALFEMELKGQISDGHWENDPRSDWPTWCDAEVVVGTTTLGRTFYSPRKTFNFADKRLTDVVGERMKGIVLDATGIMLSDASLRAELNDLKQIAGQYPAQPVTFQYPPFYSVREQEEARAWRNR